MRGRLSVAAVALTIVAAGRADAQSPAPDAPPPARVSLSLAGGPMQSEGRQVLMGIASAQVPLARHVVLEGEFGRWTEADAPGLQVLNGQAFEVRRRTTTIAGANLLFRAGTRTVTGFAGGGWGAHRVVDAFDRPVDGGGAPIGGAAASDARTAVGAQGLLGVEMALAPRWSAFAAVRMQVQPDPNLGIQGGARLHLLRRAWPDTEHPRPALLPAPAGGQIRVTRLDGSSLTGRLVSISTQDVVLRRGGREETVPLAGVRRVQRQSHWARNLALAGVGTFGAILAGDCAGSCSGEAAATLALYSGVAAGAGFTVGALINAATAAARVIYP